MGAKATRNVLLELLKLPEEELIEISNMVSRLWTNGHILVEREKEHMQVKLYAQALEGFEIKGVEKGSLPSMIGSMIELAELFIHNVKNGEISPKDLGIPEADSKKLKLVWNELTKSDVLPELDFKIHSNSATIETRSVDCRVKFINTSIKGRMFPCLDVGFFIDYGGERKFINFEITRTDLQRLIKELQEGEKQIDRLESTISKERTKQ